MTTGTGGTAAVQQAYGQFTSYRTLDPIRAAALAAAVQYGRSRHEPGIGDILHAAGEFEAYLAGEEAYGQS